MVAETEEEERVGEGEGVGRTGRGERGLERSQWEGRGLRLPWCLANVTNVAARRGGRRARRGRGTGPPQRTKESRAGAWAGGEAQGGEGAEGPCCRRRRRGGGAAAVAAARQTACRDPLCSVLWLAPDRSER